MYMHDSFTANNSRNNLTLQAIYISLMDKVIFNTNYINYLEVIKPPDSS